MNNLEFIGMMNRIWWLYAHPEERGRALAAAENSVRQIRETIDDQMRMDYESPAYGRGY